MRSREKYGRTGQATDDNTVRRMCFTCYMTKATDTHLEGYEILIAFPLQLWLRECAYSVTLNVYRLCCFILVLHTGIYVGRVA